MRTKIIISLFLLVALMATSLVGCAGQGEPEEAELETVLLLPQLNFELADLVGEKVWTAGFYGDESFTDYGVGFLVLNFDMLMVDEKLPEHSFAMLDGELPPAAMNSAEILVYGEVKDFAQTYGVFTVAPTPLVTVEEYYILSEPGGVGEWGNSYLLASLTEAPAAFAEASYLLASLTEAPAAFAEASYLLSSLMEVTPPTEALAADGTEAQDCDRALIISGGVDASNNHPRYRDNVIAKYERLRELGFTDDQIDVVYNDGNTINVDGTDIVDEEATKQNIEELIEQYADEMPASCTLTIFVTDHGTGYNDEQGYHGTRPALPGSAEYEGGLRYPENTFKIDARAKVYRQTNAFTVNGNLWCATKTETGKWEIYKKEGGEWVYQGTDDNGDGYVTEDEAGEDINGDGDSSDNNYGFNLAVLNTYLTAAQQHQNNEWDTDGDGTNDVRVRWDGSKYVVERLQDGTWQKMGEDTDGDFVIDEDDGGVDWNLDGDTDDQVGFHEGINLWGAEVLWDDELAEMLETLSENGVHILVEMISCFSGGFVNNLEGIVEKIVTGSSEDTKHWNRVDADGTVYAADQKAFIENLDGIDAESWDEAWDEGTAADRRAWEAAGSNPVSENHPQVWEKPLIESESSFYETDGIYTITLVIPESLEGDVFDLEIFFGLQRPRWDEGEVLQVPAGFIIQEIAGGIRITNITGPFPLTPLVFKFRSTPNAESLRIHITDIEHKNLGYISPALELPFEEFMSGFIDFQASSSLGAFGCESFFDVYCRIDDLTDGVYPITYAALYINGELWDSWDVYTTHFERTILDIPADCGETIETELVGMNLVSNEPIVVRTESFTTPEPTPEPEEALYGYLGADTECSCVDYECVGCNTTITLIAEDTSTGDIYPVTYVALYVDGALVYSETTSTSYYQHSIPMSVSCYDTTSIRMIARNSIGLEVEVSGIIDTTNPCPH